MLGVAMLVLVATRGMLSAVGRFGVVVVRGTLVMLLVAVRVDPLLASLSILPHVRTNATMGVCFGSAVGVLEGAMVTIMPSWRVSVSRTSLPRQSKRFQGS